MWYNRAKCLFILSFVNLFVSLFGHAIICAYRVHDVLKNQTKKKKKKKKKKKHKIKTLYASFKFSSRKHAYVIFTPLNPTFIQ